MNVEFTINGRTLKLRADPAEIADFVASLRPTDDDVDFRAPQGGAVGKSKRPTDRRAGDGLDADADADTSRMTFDDALESDPYLAEIATRSVDALPAAGYFRGLPSALYAVRQIGDKSPVGLCEWFCRQLSLRQPLLPAQEGYLILCVALAIWLERTRPDWVREPARFWSSCLSRRELPPEALKFCDQAEAAYIAFLKQRPALDRENGPLAKRLRREG